MQKMKSRSRELDEIKKGQELELSKMLEQKRQFKIQRQKKLEEEAELQESIEELELKEKEIKLNQLKASKLKMEMEAIRKDDECVKKNLKILRLRRCELLERIQLKKTSLETETKEKLKKPEPKNESGILKQDHVFVGKPFVPAFDGKNFEDWKIEVECLVKSKMYPEPLLTQGIRASLKGNTRRSLQSLNPSATSAELLEKLEEVYGSLKESDALMQDFYSSKQNPSESASDWGVRVENLFQKLVRKGEIDTSQRNTILKRKFWRGLYRDKLREAMRVSHESTDTFEILRKKTRKEEDEMDSDSKVVSQNETEHSSKVHQPIRTIQNTKESKLDTVLNRMEALEREIQELRRDKSQGVKDRGGFFRGRSRFRGGRGEYRGRGRDGRDESQRRENKREPLKEKLDKQQQELTNPEKSDKKEQLNE
ncbi:hypothetical protein DPMN_162125 [Dreissena polymorpha]|uniref:Paraneoplastic antigen Ma-like C-terminal domain-containing protein n=2 Tax=Dreissena polymorpha TaxID=45954 RepID=A0A9D4IU12_DREPO|nr:hypothetical protein DPMN_162125 [Dreissena polymorpha]